ncbi:MAG: exodeoxyribonuclease VII small subunit [Sphaerochaeta sp.]|jgi:exodeoxyribonuclease VII small subunit|nr:exodeoxyribonuclease VII small subunit [Sphaerochaeta sp.]MCH3920407.1 exodeoxyribonuclease VII small subunit [Sphaerochaeta sp.]MCI2044947.1 exodeoxyribonuclease VII small subunit [Sphaerochaeta sp.]MCI2076286.1 exodeoxyribonuclease VII small subunit [Sphaerochaeta sp.]MCI2096554.1 exodeoxyribonuclease VII small subunit [Sphaerochaeta sp.]
MAFATDLKRVEEITEKLNGQGVDLEESVKLYEEGIKLVKSLEKQLDDAKRKVEIASGSIADGVTLTEVDETKGDAS